MPLLEKNQVLNYKKSDTMVIYGSGFSINQLKNKDFEILSRFDSSGFNWFCFSKIPTTYYFVREQANIPSRVHQPEETIENFIGQMNRHPYLSSCLLLHKISHHSPAAYDYAENANQFKGNYFIVNDIKMKNNRSGIKNWRKIEKGLIHGGCTLNNIMHFTIALKYKIIIFVGIDLYDSKYFWLKEKETRYAIKNKKKTYRDRHLISGKILKLIREVKMCFPEIQMYTYNPKSLLNKEISVWK